jgi:hypothetical protein
MRIFDIITEVEIDNVNGLGSVPYNQDVKYRGMKVAMRPSTFLKLAAPLSDPRSVDHLKQHISKGGTIGAPFLTMEVNGDDPTGQLPRIVSHEGRNRMLAIQEVEDDRPIEVHIFFRGAINRARHLTPEIKQHIIQGAKQENTGNTVSGPLWKEI